MKKIIRLTESDLNRIVKRVLKESKTNLDFYTWVRRRFYEIGERLKWFVISDLDHHDNNFDYPTSVRDFIVQFLYVDDELRKKTLWDPPNELEDMPVDADFDFGNYSWEEGLTFLEELYGDMISKIWKEHEDNLDDEEEFDDDAYDEDDIED